MRRLFRTILLCKLIVIMFLTIHCTKEQITSSQFSNSYEIGTIVSDFELETVDGKIFRLSDYKGKKIVVIELGACTWPPYLSKISEMDKIYMDYKDKDVIFYSLYTREPHPGQIRGGYDFSDIKQTQTHEERVAYAEEMIEQTKQKRPIIIDTFGENCIQNTLGGGMPNSAFIIDKEGKLALWQKWSDPNAIRAKLEEMTGNPN